jgi:hypothetical protein
VLGGVFGLILARQTEVCYTGGVEPCLRPKCRNRAHNW